MSLPSKGLEGHMSHYCHVMVASWGHLERHVLGGATNIIILWSGGHEFLNYGK